MPDQGASERSQQATPERLKRARQEGQVPQSQEVPNALITAMLLVGMVFSGGGLLRYFIKLIEASCSSGITVSLGLASTTVILKSLGTAAMLVLAPLMALLALASVGSSLISSGWSVSAKAIRLDFSRISLVKGFKNLVSLKAFVNLLVSIGKIVVVGSVAWWFLRDKWPTMMGLHWAGAGAMLGETARLVLGVAGRLTAALAAIGLADLLFQRWNYRRELMMSHQEVKEERKEHELPIEVRSKMRSRQMAMSRKRIMKAVPTADVVVTNPTHYAVAIKYDAGSVSAPIVVAKGMDFLAERIKAIAKENDIPIMEKPELARSLYATVKEGQEIPETLYVAVAEVLAMIYRLRRHKR